MRDPHGLGGAPKQSVLLEAINSPQTQFTSDPRRIVESTAKLQDYQVKLGALAKAAPLEEALIDGIIKLQERIEKEQLA